MFKKREGMPSPALIVSIAALVIAMAGSAIALPGKARVKKDDIAQGAVTKKAIKKGAVTTKRLQDGSVTGEKIANATIGAGKIVDGVVPTYAYAYVDTDLAVTQAKNLDNATVSEQGSFVCFYGIKFDVENIQVTTVSGSGGIEDSFPQTTVPGEDSPSCDGAESAAVQFYDVSANNPDPNPPRFQILFNG